MALDGIVLLLAKFEFAGKALGHITEEGVEWGVVNCFQKFISLVFETT